MKNLAIGCGGILLIGLMLVAILAGGYNSLVGLSQSVDQQWAQVQTVYQRRADLIPNLVGTVAGAANFEKSTLVEVTQARASATQVKIDPNSAPTSPEQLQAFQQAQGRLTDALSRLLVTVERYPELRANQNFINLQAQLEGTENRIAVERGRFNEAVQRYNTAIRRFPTVVYASMFGFVPRPYFAAATGAERAPQVQFDFNKPATKP